jgi:triosephosphate isomerase (TIM)
MFYVFANWKMNPVSQREAQELTSDILHKLRQFNWQSKVKIILMPPYIWLNDVQKEISSSKLSIEIGTQNVFWKNKGAYTGEISASMAKSINCTYTLVGHSEREIYLKEDLSMIIKKLNASIQNDLIPILCLHPNDQSHLKDILREVANNLNSENLDKIIYLYEPTNAISTQEAETPSQKKIKNMRDVIKQHTSKNAKILYGGSINDNNINYLARETNLDGVLIGSKSLNPDHFIKIIKNIK